MTFDKYAEQGWDSDTKLSLILDFLSVTPLHALSPSIFDTYLACVAANENELALDSDGCLVNNDGDAETDDEKGG